MEKILNHIDSVEHKLLLNLPFLLLILAILAIGVIFYVKAREKLGKNLVNFNLGILVTALSSGSLVLVLSYKLWADKENMIFNAVGALIFMLFMFFFSYLTYKNKEHQFSVRRYFTSITLSIFFSAGAQLVFKDSGHAKMALLYFVIGFTLYAWTLLYLEEKKQQ